MLSASAFGWADNTYLNLDYSVYYQENLIEQLFSMEQGMVHRGEPSSSHQCGPVSNPGWFSPLLQEIFLQLRVLQFSPLPKNHHFQIPIRPGKADE